MQKLRHSKSRRQRIKPPLESLFEAIERNDIETIESLCQANPKVLNEKGSVSHFQAQWARGQVLRKWKLPIGSSHRAHITEDILNGEYREITPLHLACILSRSLAIDVLLRYGANIQAKDADGQLPIDYYTKEHHRVNDETLKKLNVPDIFKGYQKLISTLWKKHDKKHPPKNKKPANKVNQIKKKYQKQIQVKIETGDQYTHTELNYIAIDIHKNTPVGSLSITRDEDTDKYWLHEIKVNKEYQRKGIASEMIRVARNNKVFYVADTDDRRSYQYYLTEDGKQLIDACIKKGLLNKTHLQSECIPLNPEPAPSTYVQVART